MAYRNTKTETKRFGRLDLSTLKRCPLCQCLNSSLNPECFVCGWRNAFDQEPELIRDGLNELVDRCPNILRSLPRKRKKLVRRAMEKMSAFFRRPFDISV